MNNVISDRTTQEAAHLDALFVERLLSQLNSLELRLSALETGSQVASGHRPSHAAVTSGSLTDTRGLRAEIAFLRSELRKVNDRAASMRLDRQLRIAAARGLNKLKVATGVSSGNNALARDHIGARDLEPGSFSESVLTRREEARFEHAAKVRRDMTLDADVLVITHVYPGGRRAYGGQFIEARVRAYLQAGLRVAVIEADPQVSDIRRETIEGAEVLRVNPSGMRKTLKLSNARLFALHFPERDIWDIIKPFADRVPLMAWVHGYEARDWRELEYNFTPEERRDLTPRLDRLNAERQSTLREMFKHPNVTMVFVSKFMKKVAEDFASAKARKSVVAHNPVLQSDFPFHLKCPEDRKRILWVRSFDAHNYSNDISRDFVLSLSQKPFFEDVTVSVFGDGKHFEEITEPLQIFDNVKIERIFLSRTELADEHKRHGVMLVPTRWDSQGLTACEAMSSGLIPLATRTAAVPEFIDAQSGILAPYNNYRGLVSGYTRLYNDPEYFLQMSRSASRRAQSQCGYNATIAWEIALIESFMLEKRATVSVDEN